MRAAEEPRVGRPAPGCLRTGRKWGKVARSRKRPGWRSSSHSAIPGPTKDARGEAALQPASERNDQGQRFASWRFGVITSTRWTRRTGSRSRPSSARRSPTEWFSPSPSMPACRSGRRRAGSDSPSGDRKRATRSTPRHAGFQRYFHAGSFDAQLDSAGRIMLPPPLIEHASLRKEVVVIGTATRSRSGAGGVAPYMTTRSSDAGGAARERAAAARLRGGGR